MPQQAVSRQRFFRLPQMPPQTKNARRKTGGRSFPGFEVVTE
jgi:hypothetical protein